MKLKLTVSEALGDAKWKTCMADSQCKELLRNCISTEVTVSEIEMMSHALKMPMGNVAEILIGGTAEKTDDEFVDLEAL